MSVDLPPEPPQQDPPPAKPPREDPPTRQPPEEDPPSPEPEIHDPLVPDQPDEIRAVESRSASSAGATTSS